MRNTQIFIVDDVMLHPDENGDLIIELKSNENANKIQIRKTAALKMAQVMQKIYLSDN